MTPEVIQALADLTAANAARQIAFARLQAALAAQPVESPRSWCALAKTHARAFEAGDAFEKMPQPSVTHLVRHP